MVAAFVSGFLLGLLDGCWKGGLGRHPERCLIGGNCWTCRFYIRCYL